jgi:hypothetical protein
MTVEARARTGAPSQRVPPVLPALLIVSKNRVTLVRARPGLVRARPERTHTFVRVKRLCKEPVDNNTSSSGGVFKLIWQRKLLHKFFAIACIRTIVQWFSLPDRIQLESPAGLELHRGACCDPKGSMAFLQISSSVRL